MALDVDDTIAAIASAAGGALRGIVRVSGPECVRCLEQCFEATEAVRLRDVRRPRIITGELVVGGWIGRIPGELYLWPTRRSYTRQPSAELHLPGSPPLLEAALEALVRHGARIAGPGEFTLRAFLAGRLDLTQAEAVLGVINARGEKQLATALEQLAGGLATPLHTLRSDLLDLLAHLEAGLDFVEEDIEFISADDLQRQLLAAAEQVRSMAERMTSRSEASDLPRVVLIGEPNAGKSSLLNALTGEPVAIVSPQAGTTRDYVTRMTNIEGIDCLLVDTAGVDLAPAMEHIAAVAQQMTLRQAEQAEIQLLCLDATAERTAWELQQLAVEGAGSRIVVLTKIDQLTTDAAALRKLPPTFSDSSCTVLSVSSITGKGLDTLREALARLLVSSGEGDHVVAGTAARCRESLLLAGESLMRAQEIAAARVGEELVAAEIRVALDELGRVVGVVYTDDVLDRIFSRFCIGK